MVDSNKKEAGIIIAAVVLVIAMALVYRFTGGPTATEEEIVPGQILREAKEGRVIEDFPRDLILEGSPDVEHSYSIEYIEERISQPVVEYTSERTLEENVQAFQDYFDSREWTVTRAADPAEGSVTFFYAKKDETQVNVTFVVKGEEVIVHISHVSPE